MLHLQKKNSHKKILKIKIIVELAFTGKYRGAAHSICNLRFNVPNEISVVINNESNYDYHFIIKELANGFKGQFECLGENTEKHKTFSFLIEKETKKVDKNGNENIVTISFRTKIY